MAALEASSLRENFGPFVPGWQTTSEYPFGTTLNSRHPVNTKSTQVIHFNLVEFNISIKHFCIASISTKLSWVLDTTSIKEIVGLA
jgi:hypothetical protein